MQLEVQLVNGKGPSLAHSGLGLKARYGAGFIYLIKILTDVLRMVAAGVLRRRETSRGLVHVTDGLIVPGKPGGRKIFHAERLSMKVA